VNGDILPTSLVVMLTTLVRCKPEPLIRNTT
jgi:hypothetical protein